MQISLLRIVLVAFTAFAGVTGWSAKLPAAEKQRPNVLFLFADDQRPDTIAAYGNPHIKTPNLDSLVAKGFSFRRNYCMGSTHGAVCQPSRAMLNSGRTLYRVPMDLAGVKILPELFRENGYTTFGTGKWHNGPQAFLRGFAQGKAAFMGGMSDHTKVPVADVSSQGQLINKRPGESFSSTLFVNAAIDFLKSHAGEQPFYAYVAFTAPHDPRQPPEKYRKMYASARPPLPVNFMPQHPFHNGWMTGRDESLAAWPRTENVVRDQLAEYYGMITHMDAEIGRLLQTLQRSGYADNTIIVYAADHGLAVGSHGLLGKQNLYEHSMGCPLIFSGPGIAAGESSQALTYLYDIYPTLCDAVGIKAPPAVEGQSLQPIWQGKTTGVRDSLFTTYEDKMRAVRDERWKLIRYPLINHTQLFDLANDPHELKNLADLPAQSARVESMLALLHGWQQKTDDKQPLTSKNPQSKEIDLTGRKRTPDKHQPEWIRKKYFDADAS